LTLWVKPIVKDEIERRAKREGLYPSSIGAALLEKSLQQTIDLEYGALLTPVFENILSRSMEARDNRLALLLVRNYLVAEQNRGLTTYLVGRAPDITPDTLNDILDTTFKEAKKKLTRRSPELEKLIREVKSWLLNEDKQPERGKGKG